LTIDHQALCFYVEETGYSNSSAQYNAIVGYQAGYNHSTCDGQTIIGNMAGYNDVGGSRICFDFKQTIIGV